MLAVQNLSVPKDPRVWRQARTLAAAGYDVTVISPRDPRQARREVIDRVSIVRYRAPHEATGVVGLVVETLASLVGITLTLLGLMRSGPIDVFHAANPPDVYFPLGWLVRRRGGKFVYDLHDPTIEVIRAKAGDRRAIIGLARWLEARSLRTADLVITVNGTCRQLALNRGSLPAHRVVVIRTGPDARADVVAERSGVPRIVFAGIIGEQDGVEVLLRSFARVIASAATPVTLEIVGAGPDVERLKSLCEALGIASGVQWTGWVARDELARRIAAASIAVSPDEDTELNRLASMLKIADYLAQGVPTVVSDLPETRVTCGDAVAYVPPGDVAALTDKLLELLGDTVGCAQLSAAARDRSRRLLWAPSGERLLACYRWLLDDGPALAPDQEV